MAAARVSTTMRFCDEVGLRAVRVRKEIRGFLWNRVWPELDSSVQTTLRAFVPVFGPLQMTDLIGHDTLRDISNALHPQPATDATASMTVQQLVADGRRGVKRGRGFYDDNDQHVADLTKRLCRIAGQLAAESG